MANDVATLKKKGLRTWCYEKGYWAPRENDQPGLPMNLRGFIDACLGVTTFLGLLINQESKSL
jgi:hypothetical protein